jgi:DNA-binding NarL/FixJ family response regulator
MTKTPQAFTGKTTRRRVFIVDDHPLVREWLASLVAQETDLAICGQADSAPSALAAIPLCQPDIAVVDLSLRESSGLELIKDLRAQYPAMELLVLSMHEETGYAERAFRAGARGYIVKRESGSRVVEGIRAVLAGRFYASESLMSELAGRIFGGAGRTAATAAPIETLSDREMEVFQLRGQGHGTKEIAEYLRVSVKTIESYDARIKEKLGLQSAAELMREAVRWHDRRSGV